MKARRKIQLILSRWSMVLLFGLLLVTPISFASDDEVAEIVERVRALEKEIAELLDALPPELRQKVEQALERDVDSEQVAEEPASGKIPQTPSPAESTPRPAPPVAPSEVPAVSTEPMEERIAESSPAPSPPPPPRRRNRCQRLAAFDGNGDGQINALDRHWRHFYVWQDRNRDGQWQDGEISSAYDEGVRGITTDLDTFGRKKDRVGEIRIREGLALLDLRGNGFREGGSDDSALMIDASALARGSGPALIGPTGEVLAGMEPLRPGLSLRSADGQVTSLDCP